MARKIRQPPHRFALKLTESEIAQVESSTINTNHTMKHIVKVELHRGLLKRAGESHFRADAYCPQKEAQDCKHSNISCLKAFLGCRLSVSIWPPTAWLSARDQLLKRQFQGGATRHGAQKTSRPRGEHSFTFDLPSHSTYSGNLSAAA